MAYSTPGQMRARVLAFMREQLLEGRSPTVREVQAAFGFKSVNAARRHLDALVADGSLRKAQGLARGYRLDDAPLPTRLIPLLGQVQAGALTTAIEYPDGYLPLEADRADGVFGLKVKGDSMIRAGILPGDVVIVRRQQSVRDRDIVVALVGDEATVKTYREVKGRIELHPENEVYTPIVPLADGEPFEILGKVIEIRRKLS